MRLVQKSNGPLAEYESGSADDAKGAPAFFVDLSYMQGPGDFSLKGEANNFERGIYRFFFHRRSIFFTIIR